MSVLALTLGPAAIGGIGWTLAEYLIHRFQGHDRKGKGQFSREHKTHHGRKGYFTPTWKKVSMALVVLLPMAALASWLLGPLVGLSFTLGFATTYTLYEVIHWTIHALPPRTAYGRMVRVHHLYHHFHEPRSNFGVTFPLWDMVFGTYRKAERVRIPRRHVDDWMVGDNGTLKEEWSDIYEIRVRRRRVSADEDLKAAFSNRAPE